MRKLALAIIFRLFNAQISQTFFSPDEYWQSLEVAHRMVFGYGYLTWEWTDEIRSIIHPSAFALVFQILAWLNVDSRFLVINAPKYLQAVLAGLSDYYTFKMAKEWYGSDTGKWTLVSLFCSWFMLYTSTRTFVNSMESVLVMLALYFWPRKPVRPPLKSLILASLSCIIRPTCFLFWLFMGLHLIIQIYHKSSFMVSFKTILYSLSIVALIFTLSIAADSYYYGHYTLTAYNFYFFNLKKNVSVFYGAHSIHWYFTQGIPTILTSFLPLFYYGIFSHLTHNQVTKENHSADIRKFSIFASLIVTLLLSVLTHKEFRFLQPFVPIFLIVSSSYLNHIILWKTKTRQKFLTCLIFLPQILMGLYFVRFHQPGVIQVFDWLHSNVPSHGKVLFLMPCHSTPYHSYLHRSDVDLEMISCFPPINTTLSMDEYMTETDKFYESPVTYTKNLLTNTRYFALVLFENLLERQDTQPDSNGQNVSQIFKDSAYELAASYHNSHFIDDDRKIGKVQILVQANGIKHASLHIRLPLWAHLYIWPFALVYPALTWAYLLHYDTYFRSEEWTFLAFGGTIVVHALIFLSCHWSNALDVTFTCKKAKDVFSATHIRIVAAEHRGKGTICPLSVLKVKPQLLTGYINNFNLLKGQKLSKDRKSLDFTRTLFFEFQKKRFFYDEDKKHFKRADYPINHLLADYKSCTGHDADLSDMINHFGYNRFDIPIPTFQELFKEHATAPFFVFQIFCVGLWFMDEYWYYSLFTLAMLFVFESTLVFQRLRNLQELRSMAQHPYDIFVFRNQTWTIVKSDQLLPGDLISIVRQKSDEVSVPCDILIIDGSCIANEAMLSGESTPLVKESIQTRDDDLQLDIKSPESKPCILFGGTKIIQHSPPETSSLVPPDGGCLGYVLRTGFGTLQGKLVRTMIFSTERVTANNWEAFLFILLLLVFAIASSAYVWQVGIESGRKKSKLILECILIVTSVVPPELPLELSMAVNQSLVALSRHAIFCLEPFRIPFAGKLDVCCFDKTGTLTSESLVLEGIAGTEENFQKLVPVINVPSETKITIASCHSLIRLDDAVIGDPMEKTLLDSMGWKMTEGDVIVPDSESSKVFLKIVRKFPFSSALKRMSTISNVNLPEKYLKGINPVSSTKNGRYLVSVKGAPEVLQTMLSVVPKEYESTYKHFAMNGFRVLALGMKWFDLSKVSPAQRENDLQSIERTEVESSLTFCGFLILNCPLKKDTAAAIQELHESMHRMVMITGDSPLTAFHVASELGIVRNNVLILDTDEEGLYGKSIDESFEHRFSADDLKSGDHTKRFPDLYQRYHFCATGKAVECLENTLLFEKDLVTKIWVYARVSPSQKEYVLLSLKRYGFNTLMCGDGTNDVGALKQAHIGVALLDGTIEDLQKIAKNMRERRIREMKQKQEEMYKQWGIEPPKPKEESQMTAKEKAIKLQQAKMEKMMDNMNAVEDTPVIKFGDASVAAPFTSKIGSVQSICNIIRQGRCTLVTTIQMYKILALNSLISAFSLSALYLDGIKHSDTQVTIQGFLLSGCFLFLSWGKPIERLSKERPQSNIFNPYIMTSVFGQFIVHIASLWFVVTQSKLWMPEDWNADLESSKYVPNVLSNAVYLISISMQVSTFMINYQGRPFRESLRENRPLYMSLTGLFLFSIFCASEISREFNESIELVEFPVSLRNNLVMAILADSLLSFLIEYISKALFANSKPHKSLGLEDSSWLKTCYYKDGLKRNPEQAIKAVKFEVKQ